jgi:aspartate carbamoyltransferase catalytic subunit
MGAKLKHFIESQQLNKPLIDSLFKTARSFDFNSEYDVLKGKIVALLFYEQSSRTSNSFKSAAQRLGAKIIGTENAKEFSSVAKGESLEDTIRVFGGFAHGIVLRHSEEGSAKRAAEVSRRPIINAGDGRGQHPTQALLDIYTIKQEIGRLDDFSIAFVGDLAYGRTVRSLCYLLGKFDGVDITFVSPENLRIGTDIKDYLTRHGVNFKESTKLDEVLPKADIVYVTRIQKERMAIEDYEKARGLYVINQKNLGLVRREARVMHPLPHVEEIDLPVKIEETDERIAYFRQAENGMYVRMALLSHMLR